MESKRRTQVERSATSRRALIGAARDLFAQEGYASVGTSEVAAAAGMTRGALYHQFTDKLDLFTAVVEQVEEEITDRIAGAVLGGATDDPIAALAAGAEAWLDACADPEVQRIVLLDAPAVLGWERWREIALRYGLGLTEAALQAGIDSGRIADQPVRPLAHVLVGALDEAALYVARADDPGAARAEVLAVVQLLLGGLVTGDPPDRPGERDGRAG